MQRTGNRVRLVGVALIAVLWLAGGTAFAQTADAGTAAFTQAKSYLTQSQFERALESYAAAAQAAPQNAAYRQEYALLRQVVALRQSLASEADAARWNTGASALRVFYYDRGLYDAALPLDQERYRRDGAPESAALLAETQLQLDRNTEAVVTLTAVSNDKLSPKGRDLLALAYARTGSRDRAKDLLAQAANTPESAEHCLLASRVHALLGDREAANKLLAQSFRLTPPSALPRAKEFAKNCADFRSLLSDPQSASVFETVSTVQESSCSRAKSCGGCPSAAKCGSSGGTGQSGK
jgi:tetratricopeptide (TPR) repeat protein